MSHHYRGRLRPRAAYAMGLIWWFSRIASHMPRFTNIVLGVPLSGRFVKWLGGLAEQRTLPRYANQTFTNWFAHRDAPPAPSNAGDVLLWPATWKIGRASCRERVGEYV